MRSCRRDTRERDLFVWAGVVPRRSALRAPRTRSGIRSSRSPPSSRSRSALAPTPPCSRCSMGCCCAVCPSAAPQELVRVDVTFARRIRIRRPPDLRHAPARSASVQQTLAGLSGLEAQSGHARRSRRHARQLTAALVTGNAFELIGLRPRIGRLIAPTDDVRGGPAEGWPVVLSDVFWRERFDATRTSSASRSARGPDRHRHRHRPRGVPWRLAGRRAEALSADAVSERLGHARRAERAASRAPS